VRKVSLGRKEGDKGRFFLEQNEEGMMKSFFRTE
jgi:hypothetical protein